MTKLTPDRTSFLNTTKWVDDVRNERGEDVIIVLVGNKTDLNDKRQVTQDELEKRAKELNIMSIETSAKAGHNVKTLFKKIAMALPGGSTEAAAAAENQSEWDVERRRWGWLEKARWAVVVELDAPCDSSPSRGRAWVVRAEVWRAATLPLEGCVGAAADWRFECVGAQPASCS